MPVIDGNLVHNILTPIRVNGVTIDPTGAAAGMVLTFLTAENAFVARPQAGGIDEGAAAMIAGWMMGSD